MCLKEDKFKVKRIFFEERKEWKMNKLCKCGLHSFYI